MFCCTARRMSGLVDTRTAPNGGGAHVANADSLDLARLHQFLHLLPRVDVVVRVDDVPLAVGPLGKTVVVAYGASSWISPTCNPPPRSGARNNSPSGFINNGQCCHPVSLSPTTHSSLKGVIRGAGGRREGSRRGTSQHNPAPGSSGSCRGPAPRACCTWSRPC